MLLLEEWLEAQRINGGPHGLECVGVERLRQLWDAAQVAEREECAKACEETEIAKELWCGIIIDDGLQTKSDCAAAIRMRSNTMDRELADANILAAAPCLLEALIALERQVIAMGINGCSQQVAAARAAITKAGGEA